ncbi:OmpA family protein [Cellulosimicrobium protaetiae]|uniref:OmpA family protein n=1 Tax=Cellulosimicrobium protaetiae TaxID=2587808 RepID=A0A6M5UK44_9MICO|nr:OmpA family protein [Cellulosimicrobium protaetiae]QJW37488.1 OmpA family protein [Cellulosimicrobium protaetiae]
MHQRNRTRRAGVAPVLLAGVALTLAGCGADAPDPGPGQATSAPPTLSTDPTPVAVQGNVLGLDIEGTVGPLVVDGDLAVLRVELGAIGGEGSLLAGNVFGNRAISDYDDSFDGVRLVDLDSGVVREAARSVSGKALAELGDQYMIAPGREPVVGFVAFDAPTTPTTAVLVPSLGLVEEIPVVAAADADGLTVPVADLAPSGVDDVVAPTAVLETYSATADDAVRTRDTGEKVSVNVSSDVLFAVDSADLGPEADTALEAVARELALAADGELVVAGHTDDVGDDAANQDLSERRARAVADRLGQVADLGRFDVRVEGRGEREPVTAELTDEARALNRRVTVEFTAADEPVVAEGSTDGDAVPAAGPTVEGLGGATLEHLDSVGAVQDLHVELVEVRRAGGYLVGTLDVRNDGTDYATFVSVLGSVRDGRGDLGSGFLGASNVTLLDGGVRVYPVDYLVEPTFYDLNERNVLADLQVGSLNPGVTSRVTVVWPDTGAGTVVVDVPDGSTTVSDGSTPVRFVDVPVAD